MSAQSAKSSLPLDEAKDLLAFAEDIADRTRGLILDLWQLDLGTQLKEDKSPVTNVDLRAEELARDLISQRFPAHGVIGEEYEPLNPGSDYQWTVDPIDGTQNLVNGIPTFGTLIGLRFKGEAVIGIIDHPALDLRSSGGRGLGVTHNGSPITLPDLSTATLSDNDIIATNSIAVFGEERRDVFDRVMAVHPHARIYYDCYAHTLVLTNCLAAVLEPNMKIWDVTPSEALIKEAGGIYTVLAERPSKGATSYDVAFGKPKAVALLAAAFQ